MDASATPACTDATGLSDSAAWYRGRPQTVITAGYFGCFFALGLCIAALGPIQLLLSERLSMDVNSTGMFFTARAVGYLVGSIVGGVLVDRIKRTHALIVAAAVLCAAGVALLPLTTSAVVVTASVATQGLCMGVLDTGGNVLLLWLHGPVRVEPYMQLMHFFFGCGAFASPLLIEAVVASSDHHDRFDAAFYAMSAVLLAVCLPLCAYRGPCRPRTPERSDGRGAGSSSGGGSSRRRLVALCALLLLVYVGTEVSFGGYVQPFAVMRLSMDSTAGRLLNSGFWFSLSVGRLAAAAASRHYSPRSILSAATAGALASSLPLRMSDSTASAPLACLATVGFGFSMGPIFATVLTLAEREMPVSGRITTVFVVCAAFGEMLLPLLVSLTFCATTPAPASAALPPLRMTASAALSSLPMAPPPASPSRRSAVAPVPCAGTLTWATSFSDIVLAAAAAQALVFVLILLDVSWHARAARHGRPESRASASSDVAEASAESGRAELIRPAAKTTSSHESSPPGVSPGSLRLVRIATRERALPSVRQASSVELGAAGRAEPACDAEHSASAAAITPS